MNTQIELLSTKKILAGSYYSVFKIPSNKTKIQVNIGNKVIKVNIECMITKQ